MNLIFSTAYDRDVHKETHGCEKLYVGTNKLLNILERELGLFYITYSPQKRISSYKKCIENLQDKDSFYYTAFEKDKLTVAEKLLAYRDELIFSGWNYLSENQPKRLKDLSKIELEFTRIPEHNGAGDRWQQVLQNLTDEKIPELKINEIILYDPLDYLPPLLKSVFHKLKRLTRKSYGFNDYEKKNDNLSTVKSVLNKSINDQLDDSEITLKNLNSDQSLTVLKVSNEQILFDAMAFYASENEHIFINNNNANFDFSLVSLGKNASGSSQIDANPRIVQLFKLVIPCFSQELNIEALFSLLQLPYSPIPLKLSSKLSRSLMKKPGVGNNLWNEIILEYLNADNQEELPKEKEERQIIADLFLNFDKAEDSSRIKKCNKIFKYIINWAEKQKKGKQPEIEEQFSFLIELSQQIIDEIPFIKKADDLEQLINNIYKSKNYKNFFKQQNSVEVISGIEQLAQPTSRTVIWLDFHSEFSKSISLKFLLSSEIEYLMQKNLYYGEDDQVKLKLHQWLRGIFNCNNRLILCYNPGDENIEKHLLHIRFESLIKDFNKSITINLKEITDLKALHDWSFSDKDQGIPSINIELPEPVPYFDSEVFKKIKRRESESASSIEKFVQYPFDWVMQYIAQFNDYEKLELPGGILLKGNIAHKVVENLFQNHINKRGEKLNISDEQFNHQFDMVVEQEGAVLLQNENRFDLEDFRFRFRNALHTLINIINDNNLTVIGCEVKFGDDKDCIVEEAMGKVNGSIDLLLEESSGNSIVMDLKWTYSDKKYKEYLEKGNALQLALYTAALGKKEMAHTGYFLLNQNKLLTAYKFEGEHVHNIQEKFSNQSVLDKLKKSIEYRWQEIQQGQLEMGESLKFDNLKYYQNGNFNTKNEGLFISLPEEGISKTKKENPYNDFHLFKGTLG